jgi:hypothetical protein
MLVGEGGVRGRRFNDRWGREITFLMEMMLMESRYLEYVMFIQSPDMIVGEWHGQS